MSIIEYDPSTCVTAKELRANGVQIPLEIPDPAWVPKTSVHYDVRAAETTYDEEAKRITSIIPVHVDAEFQWHRGDVQDDVITMGEHRARVSEKP